VAHGHILLNGRKCDIPSILLKAGDKVTVKSRPKTMLLVKLNQQNHPAPIPDFLVILGAEPPEGQMTRLPTRHDVDPRLTKDRELQEQLIIEVSAR
jgi:small subunit ribosomal protein S4